MFYSLMKLLLLLQVSLFNINDFRRSNNLWIWIWYDLVGDDEKEFMVKPQKIEFPKFKISYFNGIHFFKLFKNENIKEFSRLLLKKEYQKKKRLKKI